MPPSPSEPVWLGSLQHGAARKELPGAPAESGHGSFQSRPRWRAPGAAISRSTVGHEHKQTAPRTQTWTWLVIGLAFVAVTAMLYGPFIWELTHG